jgi:DnaJ-class molecular chaperone
LPTGFACTPISFSSPEGEKIPLHVKIQIEDSQRLKINGHDLISAFNKKDIRNGKLIQTLPDGTKLGIRIPESYDGQSNLRISNKGMPKRDGTRGDFVLVPMTNKNY